MRIVLCGGVLPVLMGVPVQFAVVPAGAAKAERARRQQRRHVRRSGLR